MIKSTLVKTFFKRENWDNVEKLNFNCKILMWLLYVIRYKSNKKMWQKNTDKYFNHVYENKI